MTNRLYAIAAGILPSQYERLLIVISAAVYGLLITLSYSLFHDSPAVLFLLFAVVFNGLLLVAWRSAEGRIASAILAIALLARFVAALLFHRRAGSADPFAGSPDAWSYHVWGVRLAEAFRHGDFPAITAWYQTGRWDVGYHYVLGLVYLVFGESLLVGRLLGAFFGALSVLMLLLVARRLAPERGAVIAAVVYALWPMSIGWSSETILRDSFVWFLLLAAVWLSLRLAEHVSLANWCALVGALAFLRYTRPYAAFFVIAGLCVAFVLAAFSRLYRQVLIRTAAAFMGVLVAIEVLFVAISFPSAISVVQGYDLPHWAMRSMPVKSVQLPSHTPPAVTSTGAAATSSKELPSAQGTDGATPSEGDLESAQAARELVQVAPEAGQQTREVERSGPTVPAPSAAPPRTAAVARSQTDGSGSSVATPEPSQSPVAATQSNSRDMAELPPPPDAAVLDAQSTPQHSSLAGNAVRFLLGPFGWTFYLPGNSVWPVYSMWLWYLLLPAAAAGALSLLLRGSVVARSLVVTSAMYAAVLMLVGRGDAYRQREMVVPIVILIAVTGIIATRNRRKILIPLYAVWICVLGAAAAFHVRSVAARGRMSVIASPAQSRVEADLRECGAIRELTSAGKERECETSGTA